MAHSDVRGLKGAKLTAAALTKLTDSSSTKTRVTSCPGEHTMGSVPYRAQRQAQLPVTNVPLGGAR